MMGWYFSEACWESPEAEVSTLGDSANHRHGPFLQILGNTDTALPRRRPVRQLGNRCPLVSRAGSRVGIPQTFPEYPAKVLVEDADLPALGARLDRLLHGDLHHSRRGVARQEGGGGVHQLALRVPVHRTRGRLVEKAPRQSDMLLARAPPDWSMANSHAHTPTTIGTPG